MTSDEIREKHRARQERERNRYEAHKAAVASGEKKLLIDTLPNGLCFCRFEGGGVLPDLLKGHFTSRDKIKQLVEIKYGQWMIRE